MGNISDEELNKILRLNKDFYEKLCGEFESYKEDIVKLPPSDIVQKADQITLHKDIVDAVGQWRLYLWGWDKQKYDRLLDTPNLLDKLVDACKEDYVNPFLDDAGQIGHIDHVIERVYEEIKHSSIHKRDPVEWDR